MSNYQKAGYALTMLGGLFWALSGVCGQFLFEYRGWEATHLVPLRLLAAGVVMVIISCTAQRKEAFRIFKSKRDIIDLVIFALLGVGACQLTYFLTIQFSNAATATVLCYAGPVMIIVYMALRNRKLPSTAEMLAVVMVIAGTFLLATHGSFTSLVISGTALVCGLASSVSAAIYSIQPRRIIQTFGTVPVTGWGMLIAGITMSLILKPWHIVGVFDMAAMAAFGVIVILGTVLSFSFFLEGVRRIGAVKGSILGATEPLGSTVMSIALLGVVFTTPDIIGFIMILSTVFILAWNDTIKAKRAAKENSDEKNVDKTV